MSEIMLRFGSSQTGRRKEDGREKKSIEEGKLVQGFFVEAVEMAFEQNTGVEMVSHLFACPEWFCFCVVKFQHSASCAVV